MKDPYLEIRSGNAVMQYTLTKFPVTVGRSGECRLPLPDPMVSRTHCVFEQTGVGLLLRDLGSTGGTRVNGRPIKEARITSADTISLGRTEMRLVGIVSAVSSGESTPDGEEVEVLSADDVIDTSDLLDDAVVVPPRGPQLPRHRSVGPLGLDDDEPIAIDSGNDDDPEQRLESLAASLAEIGMDEHDIALIGSRGQTIHAASDTGKRGPRREAVDLFRLLLLICFKTRATDIHIEPRQEQFQIRLRIDGTMVDVVKMPTLLGTKLAALVKVLADVDISKRDAIQEGHFSSKVPNPKASYGAGSHRRVDYRCSFAPSVFGQKLVIRILDAATAPAKVTDLGLPSSMISALIDALEQDSGMILVSGPTGSGKTTTLYSLVRSINLEQHNVTTIEDPVEIQLEGVTQIPVDEAHEKSFSQLLRSMLRQDPDVIMVGEIRDAETARIAMQAAMTGHMVFSTIHTKDTVGAIFRMIDLGVEPYMVAQGLHIVIAQRLVRTLCPHCKKPVRPTPEQLEAMGDAAKGVSKIYTPAGCPRCLGTGFAGRRAFFEMFRANDKLRDVILTRPNIADINEALAGSGFTKLSTSGFMLVAEGAAAFTEIEKAVGHQR